MMQLKRDLQNSLKTKQHSLVLIQQKLKIIIKINDLLEVSVNFISEIITCIKDKENKIVSGDPQKLKESMTLGFSRNIKSQNPNWQLIETKH